MGDQNVERVIPVTGARRETPRQHFALVARLVVTVALIVYVLRVAHADEIWHIILAAHWAWLLLAVILLMGAQILCSLRWALVSQPLQLGGTWRAFFSLYFLGAFFNMFLPTAIGGDVVKAYYLARDTRKLARSTASVFMDRNVGLGSLLIVGCVAATVRGATLHGVSVVPLLWLALIGYYMGNAVVLGQRIHGGTRRLLCHLGFARLEQRLSSLFGVLTIYRRNLLTLAAATVFSLGVTLATFVTIFFIGLAIGSPAALKDYLVFLPLITVMTMLPVSIGGLGVRESAFVAFFVPVGLTPEQSVTLGFLWHAVTVVASLPGGWIYLTYRRHQAMPEPGGGQLLDPDPEEQRKEPWQPHKSAPLNNRASSAMRNFSIGMTKTRGRSG